jgi:hypothetical protein
LKYNRRAADHGKKHMKSNRKTTEHNKKHIKCNRKAARHNKTATSILNVMEKLQNTTKII